MAKIIQPKEVTQLDPTDPWNRLTTNGFKFHLTVKDGNKTACDIILEARKVNICAFSKVKPKDLCAVCFKGLEIVI